MKIRKYIAVFLVLAGIAVIGIYQYRDSIARNVANTVLRNSDLAVTDLSIDSIGTNFVYFDELVLEQLDGARIRVVGVALPTNTLGSQPDSLRIDQLEIMPGRGAEGPAAISAILTAILGLPQTVPYSVVEIGHVVTEGIPALMNVSWESGEAGQSLNLTIGTFAITTGIEQSSDAESRVSIAATTPDGTIAVALALAVLREESGYALNGQSTARVGPLLPVLQAIGMLPADLESIDALLWGEIHSFIPHDAQQPFLIEATSRTDNEVLIEYRLDADSTIDVGVETQSPTLTQVEFPSLKWSSEIETANMTISMPSFPDLPLSVSLLQCETGVICTMQADFVADNLTFDSISIASAVISAPVTISIGDGTQVMIAATTTAEFGGIRTQSATAETINLGEFSGANVVIDDTGLRIESEKSSLQLNEVALPGGIASSFAITLTNTHVNDNAEDIASTFSIDSSTVVLTTNDLSWSVPDVFGDLNYSADSLSVSAEMTTADQSFQTNVMVRQDFATGGGTIATNDLRIDFGSSKFSQMVSPPPASWDISGGTALLAANLNWQESDNDVRIFGNANVTLDDIAAFRNDIVASGLTTTLNATIDTLLGHKIDPAKLSLELIDVGLPITNVNAEFRIGESLSSVDVDALSMNVLGGSIYTEPFEFSLEAPANPVIIRLESIQLALMKALAEFDSIDIEGSVSGVLPATVSMDLFTIDKGLLSCDDPGGAIRYHAGDSGEENSQLGLATRALSNFEFETLTSEVTYNENGDLILGMRMEGVNPEMDPNQPVVLNLNLENNVPEMLRSLQATRSIQEIFEKNVN